MSSVKSYEITKQSVWDAYERVKANKGAAGVDGQTIAMFEENLKDNLYKLWNRMSSGSYFPSAVRYVDIPKSDGKTRTLGIPTVSDRIAQMVVKMQLEPKIEPHFHPDSYGYRPRKSAHDAIGMTRIIHLSDMLMMLLHTAILKQKQTILRKPSSKGCKNANWSFILKRHA